MMTKIYGLIAAVVICGASIAQAATETQTLNWGEDIPEFSETLTFDKFDTQGGARSLTDVTIELTIDISDGQLTVDNDSEASGTVDAELGGKASITSGDVLTAPGIDVSALTTASFDLDPNQGDGENIIDGASPDGAVLSGQAQSDANSVAMDNIGSYSFDGTDSYDLTVDASNIFAFSGLGGVEGGFSPVTSSGDVTVTYDYVPEPAAAALLGIGGLVMLRRRR